MTAIKIGSTIRWGLTLVLSVYLFGCKGLSIVPMSPEVNHYKVIVSPDEARTLICDEEENHEQSEDVSTNIGVTEGKY